MFEVIDELEELTAKVVASEQTVDVAQLRRVIDRLEYVWLAAGEISRAHAEVIGRAATPARAEAVAEVEARWSRSPAPSHHRRYARS